MAQLLTNTAQGRPCHCGEFRPDGADRPATSALDEKITKNPGGSVYLGIQPNGPGGSLTIQGGIKVRRMFQNLNFIATGIRIALEFDVISNRPIEEADEGATATIKD